MPAPSCLSTNSTVSRVPLKTGLPAITSLRSSTKSCHLIFMGSLQLLCLLRIALALIVLDTNPLPPAVTLEDFLAEDDFAMPVDERGEIARRLEVAAVGVVVSGPEQLLERVWKALVMPAGIVSEWPHFRLEQGRIACDKLVGLVAMAEPHLVGT